LFGGLGFPMPQNCTIICPNDEPQEVLAVLRDLLQNGAEIRVSGKDADWSKIDIQTSAGTLTLNRQIQNEPGDRFSKMVLGMHNYFRQVRTPMEAIQRDVLNQVANMKMAIGVVAEPDFVEEARHYDCIFSVAAALNAIIWTGSGVINAEGQMILDGDGNSDVP
jgi:hypothetical protein